LTRMIGIYDNTGEEIDMTLTCCSLFCFRICMPSSSLRRRISCESMPLFLYALRRWFGLPGCSAMMLFWYELQTRETIVCVLIYQSAYYRRGLHLLHQIQLWYTKYSSREKLQGKYYTNQFRVEEETLAVRVQDG
jgi:hypothetical protein